jgi:hypothetical protein
MNHALPVSAFPVEADAQLRQVGVVFEAIVLEQCLAPIARGNDALGDYGIGALAQSIAERDAHGFGTLLGQLERERLP